MGEKDEPKFGNLQKGKKEQKVSEEKGRSLEDYDFFQGNLQIKFNEFDPQKGGLSPRFLFKKRKNEDTSIFFKKTKSGEDILGPTIKKETRIKNAFEALLDYVREVYFTNDHSNNETNSINNSSPLGGWWGLVAVAWVPIAARLTAPAVNLLRFFFMREYNK